MCIFSVVQSSLASSHHAAEARAVSVDNRINQASVVETTTTTTDISMAAVSVGLFDYAMYRLLYPAFCLNFTSINAGAGTFKDCIFF